MEIMLEDEDKPGLPPPKTFTVLTFLAAFAVVMSWLSCYAVPNALVAADVLKPFDKAVDPRPKWMATAFIIIFGVSFFLAAIFRWMSSRQLRQIDSTADAEDRPSSVETIM
jgi:hypothetical protein